MQPVLACYPPRLCISQVQALSGIEFSVEYAREHLVALRRVQRALTAYREAQRGPVVATVQCPGGSSRLQQDMPLLGDFPCVDKPVAVEDARWGGVECISSMCADCSECISQIDVMFFPGSECG
jgi:hypothetical protein